MYNILYTRKSLSVLEQYISAYREYFLQLYSDTGIWSEGAIQDRYILMSDARHAEILGLIEDRLMPASVVGRTLENAVTIPWRSKNLWVEWSEHGETRTVVKLEIR